MTRTAVILAILFLFVSPAWSQPVDDNGIRIFSDSLQVMDRTGTIQFDGNVRILLEGATMTCDTLTVRTSEEDPSRVISGTASGSVTMERGEEKVQADEARFNLERATVELTGSPSLIKGRSTIQADRILYSLDDGTAQFEGAVKAVFMTEGE